MLWGSIAVVVVIVVPMAFVLGSRLGEDPTLVDSPLLGRPAPTFDLETLEGGRIRSADLAGEPFVVNFWASWCIPCREEAPALRAFAERWAGSIEVVGVVWNDSVDAAREFRDEFGLTYPQALDPGGRTALDYGVAGIPETFVVDADGIVRAKLIGAVGATTLDDLLPDVRAGREVQGRSDAYETSR
ncbi:MAG: redoxin domain-containing protein [Acidimicrobiia bacterium]|nr:redoxin domain-containing protein [Acidimicrobiia bacterium]